MIDSEQPSHSYRLPSTSRPAHYDLRLAPDLEAATFTGEEEIEIEIVAPVSTVVLNSVELSISSATITPGWSSEERRERSTLELTWSHDEEAETVTFASPVELPADRYTLEIRFSGILNDKLNGFYRSIFTDDQGVERVIATTQFEETDARKAFPCYDEPAAKATYGITIDVPEGLLAVSNAPAISATPLPGGGERVRFADTMVMSTYLVAFVVGPLEATDPIDVDGTPVRVIHAPGKADLTAPALECAAHALRFFAEYFGIPYPGQKLDLVAIPDFASGAMENLGCVTFREAILLADPKSSSRSELERLAEVVEHELAHMWFGDLVTMEWWNGIWLNEAFATFMALLCQDDYRPEWQTFVGFSRGKAAALAVDGLHATRPIEFPVLHPAEAAAMFDVLTYEKGASVLWMLEQYLGRERFRDGVRKYLAAHAYANTETTDLWDAIEQAAGTEPVRVLMDSWIFHGGYPLISASALEDGKIRLSQHPFSYLPRDARADSAIGSSWLVPVLFGREETGRTLLDAESTTISLTGTPILNAGGSGFFRLHHDAELLGKILGHLDELSPTERYNLVADTWAVTVAGRGPLREFFSIIGHLGAEDDPHVWSVVIGAFGLLDLVAPQGDRPALRVFVEQLLAPHLERVGWTATDHEDEPVPLLRSSLVSALGLIADVPAVITEARRLFALDIAGEPGLAPDLASAVVGVVAAHATRADFDAIVERYRHPRSPMDEIRHLSALANVRQPELADEVYELCRTEVRSQNAPYVLGAMLRNREVGARTFSFIVEHYEELTSRFPDNSIHRMFEGVSGLVVEDPASPANYDAVASFLRSHIPGARGRLVEQSLERLEVNLRFAATVREQLGAIISL